MKTIVPTEKKTVVYDVEGKIFTDKSAALEEALRLNLGNLLSIEYYTGFDKDSFVEFMMQYRQELLGILKNS